MIWWPEIAASVSTKPERSIPVRVEHLIATRQARQRHFDYYNDSNGPFGIRYADKTARFFSLEAEHTNQVDCTNLRKSNT